jgi:hypothetical protein
MSKTKRITVVDSSATTETNNAHTIQMIIEDPNIDSLLDEIETEDLADYLQANKSVQDIFSENELEKWAEANGYVKSDE